VPLPWIQVGNEWVRTQREAVIARQLQPVLASDFHTRPGDGHLVFLQTAKKFIGLLRRFRRVFALPYGRLIDLDRPWAPAIPVNIEAMTIRDNAVFFRHRKYHEGAGWHDKRSVVGDTTDFGIRSVRGVA
jgi:hypothetical protein